MIDDCIQNATDRIILVSADTDLIPPLEIIKKRYPEKTIKVYFPPSNFSSELNDVMKRWMSKTIKLQDNKKRFENAVMPEIVSAEIHIPEKWRPCKIFCVNG